MDLLSDYAIGETPLASNWQVGPHNLKEWVEFSGRDLGGSQHAHVLVQQVLHGGQGLSLLKQKELDDIEDQEAGTEWDDGLESGPGRRARSPGID